MCVRGGGGGGGGGVLRGVCVLCLIFFIIFIEICEHLHCCHQSTSL